MRHWTREMIAAEVAHPGIGNATLAGRTCLAALPPERRRNIGSGTHEKARMAGRGRSAGTHAPDKIRTAGRAYGYGCFPCPITAIQKQRTSKDFNGQPGIAAWKPA